VDVMQEPFRKDLKHIIWAEVYARQEARAFLIDEWLQALSLSPGDHVLEVGAGPGYVTMVLADRVGREGLVYAVDRSAEALACLERLQTERRVSQIRRIVTDAAALAPEGLSVDSALISMVLHHAEDPAGILGAVARLLPPGGRAVVAEFHPEGPCEQGPPRAHRIGPEQVQAWCEGAGLELCNQHRQSPEHYMVLVRKRS
jgi:ubiquinone/menaquinone biosynthesis C-methylase UbiE